MKEYLKIGSFLRNTINYISGEVLTKGIYFLSIPLFSFLLTTKEYGNVAIFSMLYPLIATIISLNLAGYIRQGILKSELEDRMLGTLLIFQSVILLCVFPFLFIFKELIAHIVGLEGILLEALFLTSIINVFYQFYQFYLLGKNESKKYALFSLITAILNIGLSIGFILYLKKSADVERIYGIVVSFILMGGYAIVQMYRKAKIVLDRKILRNAIHFSVPLIFHAIAGMLLAQSDRFMIKKMIGDEEAGLYSYAYNAGMIMHVLVVATNNSWIPLFYKCLAEKKYEELKNKMRKYVGLMLAIAIILMLVVSPIMRLITNASYHEAIRIMPAVIFSGFIILLNNLYANYTFYEGRTYIISINTFIVTVLNIALNYFTLEKYGYQIAAWTTLISYLLLFILNYTYAVKKEEKAISLWNLIKK